MLCQFLLYTTIYKIINKDLLYSTGNSTQYSVTTYMGKASKKEWVCVDVQLLLVVENKASKAFLKFKIEVMKKLRILCLYKLFPLSPLPSAKCYCYQVKIENNKILKENICFKIEQEEKNPLGSKWHPRNNLITQPCGDR